VAVFQKRLAADGIDPKKEPERAAGKWIDNVWHGRAHSWEKMPWLIKTWKEMSKQTLRSMLSMIRHG